MCAPEASICEPREILVHPKESIGKFGARTHTTAATTIRKQELARQEPRCEGSWLRICVLHLSEDRFFVVSSGHNDNDNDNAAIHPVGA